MTNRKIISNIDWSLLMKIVINDYYQMIKDNLFNFYQIIHSISIIYE